MTANAATLPQQLPLRVAFEGFALGDIFYETSSAIAYVGEPVELQGHFIGQTDLVDSVWVRIDNTLDCAGTFVSRSDPTMINAENPRGFSLRIPVEKLPLGKHNLLLNFACGSQRMQVNPPFVLEIRPAAERPTRPRIIVAGSMKTAGRHIAAVLRRYFNIASNPRFAFDNDGEHVITDRVLKTTGDRPFAFHCHPIARVAMVQTCNFRGIRIVPTWRNLGDIVVSMEEHLRTQTEDKWRNTYMFLPERESYRAMSDQERYQFVIRNAIPWYLTFYLSWRAFRQPTFMRYEWMVADPFAYFRYIITSLATKVDEERLRSIVAEGALQESGLNVGSAGRSDTLLSTESKKLLEALLLTHPVDLTELWLELPWVADASRKPTVASSPRGELFLVHGDVKLRITSDHWLITHGTQRSSAIAMSDEQLAAYRTTGDAY